MVEDKKILIFLPVIMVSIGLIFNFHAKEHLLQLEREKSELQAIKNKKKSGEINNFAVLFYEGITLYNNARYGESADKYIEALKIIPNHINALHNLAKIYTKIGRDHQAYEVYRKIIEFDENDIPALKGLLKFKKVDINRFELAKAYFRIKNYHSAKIELQNLLKINSTNENYLYCAAITHQMLKENSKAIEFLIKLLQINQNHLQARTTLFELNNTTTTKFELAKTAFRIKNYVLAESLLEDLAAKNIHNDSIQLCYALVLENQNKYTEALSVQKARLKNHSNNASIINKINQLKELLK